MTRRSARSPGCCWSRPAGPHRPCRRIARHRRSRNWSPKTSPRASSVPSRPAHRSRRPDLAGPAGLAGLAVRPHRWRRPGQSRQPGRSHLPGRLRLACLAGLHRPSAPAATRSSVASRGLYCCWLDRHIGRAVAEDRVVEGIIGAAVPDVTPVRRGRQQ